MRHTLAIFVSALILVTACSDDNALPALVQSMLTLHEGVAGKATCEAKIAYAAGFLTKNEAALVEARDKFGRSCERGTTAGMRCQSLRMRACGEVEVELRKCRNHDVNGQIPLIFEKLHEATGAYFDVHAVTP